MEELLSKVIKNAKGYDVETSLGLADDISVNFKTGKGDNVQEGIAKTLHIRVTKNGKSGYSLTNDLNLWKDCLKRAKTICKLSKKSEFYGSNKKKKIKKVKTFSKKIVGISPEDLKEHGDEIINSVKSRVIDLSLSKNAAKVWYTNSNGVFLEDEKHSVGFGIDMKHKKNVFYESQMSVKDFDFREYVDARDYSGKRIISEKEKQFLLLWLAYTHSLFR